MGGYDLYGNYYSNSNDALNAELSQMNEIDNRRINIEMNKQKNEIERLKSELELFKKVKQ